MIILCYPRKERMNEEKKKNLTRGIISSSCFYSKVKKEVVASSSSYAATIDRFHVAAFAISLYKYFVFFLWWVIMLILCIKFRFEIPFVSANDDTNWNVRALYYNHMTTLHYKKKNVNAQEMWHYISILRNFYLLGNHLHHSAMSQWVSEEIVVVIESCVIYSNSAHFFKSNF